MARKSRQQNRVPETEALATQGQTGRDEAMESLTKQVESSHQTLQELLDQVSDIQCILRGSTTAGAIQSDSGLSVEARNDEEPDELNQLRDQVFDLQAVIADLQQQNNDLASQLASRSVESSISSGHSHSNETMSWEERKQMILNQMEEDSFDAESFITELGVNGSKDSLDPVRYVEQLQVELDRRDEELKSKGQQIHELQHLLEQQSETRDGGIAIGAAAITQMFDADELVREERERLQELQEEWEDKFRQAEIEASLERAKLSRERQEIAKKMSELEEQLAHAKREARHDSPKDEVPSRRWLAKLGLADGKN